MGKKRNKKQKSPDLQDFLISPDQSVSEPPEPVTQPRKARHRGKKMTPQLSDDDQAELIEFEVVPTRINNKKGVRVEEGDGLLEDFVSETSDDGDTDEAALYKKTPFDNRPLVQSALPPESSLMIFAQVLLPFLVAGFGMVGAGIVLDVVQHWKVFVDVSDLFIIVPALLGLKGNLEMTLASRLSTHTNLGYMDDGYQCLSLVVGNLALIQCQAIVVGLLASLAAIAMGLVSDFNFDLNHSIILCASSLVTASFASFILGLVMVAVILLSRRCRVNPDNVATPIAASLGDLTTLGLLSWIASLLYADPQTTSWLGPVIISLYLMSLPFWIWLSSQNELTRGVLTTGWTPVISAMMISSLGGVILDFAVAKYKGIAAYQPVINGVGGNLVAVQASRFSTYLHSVSSPGHVPKNLNTQCLSPFAVFCSKDEHARSSRVLLFLAVPGHLLFIFTIAYMKAGHTSLTAMFTTAYLSAAFLQVLILLYLARVMINSMWRRGVDPDNSAIPYLTALGDLVGTFLLAVSFHLLFLAGDRDSDLGD